MTARDRRVELQETVDVAGYWEVETSGQSEPGKGISARRSGAPEGSNRRSRSVCVHEEHKSNTEDIPNKQLSRDCSFLTGEMNPFELALALDSKFGGNLSSGRTNVWTEQGSDSGGVESSIRTGFPRCPMVRSEAQRGDAMVSM